MLDGAIRILPVSRRNAALSGARRAPDPAAAAPADQSGRRLSRRRPAAGPPWHALLVQHAALVGQSALPQPARGRTAGKPGGHFPDVSDRTRAAPRTGLGTAGLGAQNRFSANCLQHHRHRSDRLHPGPAKIGRHGSGAGSFALLDRRCDPVADPAPSARDTARTGGFLGPDDARPRGVTHPGPDRPAGPTATDALGRTALDWAEVRLRDCTDPGGRQTAHGAAVSGHDAAPTARGLCRAHATRGAWRRRVDGGGRFFDDARGLSRRNAAGGNRIPS